MEAHLLNLMNVAARRSTRLTGKPAPRYKETRDKRVPLEKEAAPVIEVEPGKVDAPAVTGGSVEDPGREVGRLVEIPEYLRNQLLEASSNLALSFPECIRDQYGEDKFFLPILADPGEFTNFALRDGLVFFKTEGSETITVPDICQDGQSVRETLIRQAHSILAHLGKEKTVTYMRDQVWWKTMTDDVSTYCRSCQTCVVSKSQPGKLHGKLKTMPVPTYPWQYIGIDFVGPLPESSNCTGRYDHWGQGGTYPAGPW